MYVFGADVLPEEYTDDIKRIYSLGQAICSAKNSALKLSLEQDFEYFTRACEGLEMPKRLESISEEEICIREERFMMNLFLVLIKNHYQILTQEEWDAASEEDFLLTLPVNVKWEAMDESLLNATIWKQYPDMKDLCPEACRSRILILHRGVSSAQMVGKYYSQKVELLIQFLLIKPIFQIVGWILKKLRILHINKSDAVAFQLNKAMSHSERRASMSASQDTVAKTQSNGEDSQQKIRIERRTFDQVFPDGKSVLKNLFRTITLQEACWKDVVVIYRANEKTCSKGEFSLRSDMKYQTIRRNIVLKRFSSIPIADMELVFPEKNVHFAPSVLVNIVVTIIGAIVTLFLSFKGGLSLTRAWTSLTVLGGRLAQVYQTASTQKTEIEKAMGSIVSTRQVASQNAALASIINDMFSQLTRQIFFAYCILLVHPGVTLRKLDEICEDILEKKFEVCVDFTCEQAIEILHRWGIVHHDDHGKLHPLPLSETVSKLEAVLILTSSQQTGSLPESLASLGVKFAGNVTSVLNMAGGKIDGLARGIVPPTLKLSKSIKSSSIRQPGTTQEKTRRSKKSFFKKIF